MAPPRKSVLITGCSDGGIGGGLAEVFQEKGYHVFATARTPSKISQKLASAANVTVLTLDVLSSASIAAAVDDVKKHTGGTLDVLVNNSGCGSVMTGLDVSIEDGKKMFDLNFWAPMAMMQAFASLLIEAKGCLVNNTSASAYSPFSFQSMYNSSKAALAAASETWRHELHPLGVRTITIVTCGVKTNFWGDYVWEGLPKTSKYIEVEDFIRGRTTGEMQDGAITPRQYATKVVRAIDSGAVGPVWAGKDAFAARVACALLPQSMFDKIIESYVPLSSAMAQVAQKKKA